MPAIEVRGLTVRYRHGQPNAVTALEDASLCLQPGEFVALLGRAGSGKTTLVHAMGLLLRPTSGSVLVDGLDTSDLTDGERAQLRGRRLGFLFRDGGLLQGLTVLENVVLPLRYDGFSRGGRRRARELLEVVGIGERAGDRPEQLSPGQAQRAALARALIRAPGVVLADEPTGGLDNETSDEVLYLMQQINRGRGVTFLVATHEPEIASCTDRCIRLSDGRLW